MLLLGTCAVCKGNVEWVLVKEVFSDIFDQVNAHGVDSLTEHQQVVYEGMCCSEECYYKLK